MLPPPAPLPRHTRRLCDQLSSNPNPNPNPDPDPDPDPDPNPNPNLNPNPNVQALRPTLFVSVPRLYTRIYDKVTGGAKAKGEWNLNGLTLTLTLTTTR